ncbi:class I SAM-dependent methyltransferase [Ruminococcaceae bacterium OttesenSCG-928-A16]|nr:class I SAM-dependent methyltransferase [Ruminococcaceae bacterium OttesenSCG-928-A16]
MKNTEQEMADILSVLTGQPAGFAGQGASGKTTQQVAAVLLGKTVEEMEQEQQNEESNESSSHFSVAIQQAAEQAEDVARGQSVPYYAPLGNSKRFLGRLLTGLRRLTRRFLEFIFAPILERQNVFNAAVARATAANVKAIEITAAKLQEQCRLEVEQAEQRTQQALALAAQHTQQELAGEKAERQAMQDRVERGYIQINNNMMRYLTKGFATAAPATASQQAAEKAVENTPGQELDTYVDIDYLAFENAFRGSEESIRKSQEVYLPYLAGKQKVVDIGCGRGEFLELLRDKGVEATGVDTYPLFVDLCKEKGLNVELMDGLAYLNSLEDNSVGAITAFQVAEHLPNNALVKMVELAYQKLEIGGVLIMETPNPTNLSTFTNAFYVDPSHTKPVHPATMAYYTDMAGFRQTKTVFTENSRSDYRLPLLNAEAENLEEFNNGINILTEKLFGSQDYAIIATK